MLKMKRGIYNLKNYYHKIRQNFDALASSYDNEFGENKIFQLMRETDLAILTKHLSQEIMFLRLDVELVTMPLNWPGWAST